MQRSTLRSFQLILMASQQPLGKLDLDWEPNPGGFVVWQGETYAILERRHRYRYVQGRYQLAEAVLYLQPTAQGAEVRLVNGHWTMGDSHCRFHSHSPLIHCAVHPQGPCQGCPDYEPLNDSVIT